MRLGSYLVRKGPGKTDGAPQVGPVVLAAGDDWTRLLTAYREPAAALPDASGLVTRDGIATPELELKAGLET
jgi:hypothetical protein